jgi:5'-nucleotidase
METFPFDDSAHLTYWTGAQLKHGIMWMMRDEAFMGEHVEFYQVSSALSIEYDMVTHSFLKFDCNGKPIEDDKIYTVGLQDYHFKNLKNSFDLEIEDIEKNHMHRAVATSCADVLEEMFKARQHMNSSVQGRLVLHLTDEAKEALLKSGR